MPALRAVPGARIHAPGSTVRCTHVEIPQVAETYAVMGHSPWWVWGFEHGVNEHAVAIGNETVFSKEPVEERPGLIGMDLVRLGLERGRTRARGARGDGDADRDARAGRAGASAPDGSGYHNGFLIADPDEAWLLQTSNRHWAARRVQRDAISNHISLGSDWEIGSRDLESFARAPGWWTSAAASTWRRPIAIRGVPGRISDGRLRRSRELLDARAGPRRRARRCSRSCAITWMADRCDCPGATIEDEAYFTLCMHSEPIGTTTASLVAPLAARSARAVAGVDLVRDALHERLHARSISTA